MAFVHDRLHFRAPIATGRVPFTPERVKVALETAQRGPARMVRKLATARPAAIDF
jgi:hypothetical protein